MNKHLDRLTTKFLIIISIVMVIGFSSLLISQIWMISEYRDSVIKQNMAVLDMTKATVDSNVEQALKLAQLLMLNKNITRFINQGPISEGSPEIQTIIDAQAQLPSARSVNPMLLEIYIYSKASGYLLSSTNAIFDIDMMYSILGFQDLNARQWQSKYLWATTSTSTYYPSVIATIDGQKKQVIPYVQTLPLSNPSENAGKIMLLLDQTYIADLLNNLPIGLQGQYCVTDSRDTLLLSSAPLEWQYKGLSDGMHIVKGETGKKFLVTVTSSVNSHLVFYSGIPYEQFRINQNPIWLIFSFLAIIALAVCFLLMVTTAYGSKRDWYRLRGLLSKEHASYAEITETIRSITEQSNDSERKSDGMTFMTETCFRRMLYGKNPTKEELVAMIDRMRQDIPIDMNTNLAMIKIVFHSSDDSLRIDEIDFTRIAAQRQAAKSFGNRFYLYMDYSFNIWILVWENNQQRLDASIDQFWVMFNKLIPYDISMAVSQENHTVDTLLHAPRECNGVMQSIINENKRSILRKARDVSKRSDLYLFDRDIERQLMNATTNKDLQGVEACLNNLYEENFIKRDLNPQQSQQLIKALYSTAIAYCQRQNISVLPQQFEVFSQVSSFFYQQAGINVSNKNERENQLIQCIVDYVDKHFQDPSLTLCNMASDFKMKESYLYHFMCTRMQVTFAQYLEEYRLDIAKGLLVEQDQHPINEIILKCGYANAQTFRRAFKKRFGLLPSDYRIQETINQEP